MGSTNIIRKMLLKYAKKDSTANTASLVYCHELAIADFKSFNELEKVYGKVSIHMDYRLVFNMMGSFDNFVGCLTRCLFYTSGFFEIVKFLLRLAIIN